MGWRRGRFVCDNSISWVFNIIFEIKSTIILQKKNTHYETICCLFTFPMDELPKHCEALAPNLADYSWALAPNPLYTFVTPLICAAKNECRVQINTHFLLFRNYITRGHHYRYNMTLAQFPNNLKLFSKIGVLRF